MWRPSLGDLRRAFQSAGVNLLSLDIESRGGNGAQPQEPDSGSGSGSSRQTDVDQAGAIAEGGATEQTTSSLPGSALVNVLA